MFHVIPCFEGSPINLTGGIFTTGTVLYAPMLYFVNRTTGWWYAPSFTISEFYAKETSVGELSASLFLHNYVTLFYRYSMSHLDFILVGWFHIVNWYCKISDRRLCTKEILHPTAI